MQNDNVLANLLSTIESNVEICETLEVNCGLKKYGKVLFKGYAYKTPYTICQNYDYVAMQAFQSLIMIRVKKKELRNNGIL